MRRETTPWSQSARDAGVPVWSEVELGFRLIRSPIIGITGTNGKTTTTELVGAMLRAGNVPVEVAGNVGRPLCDLAGRVDPATWIACELSSFQLEDIDSFRARVGVVLQVTPITSTVTARSPSTCAASCACSRTRRPRTRPC